MKHLLFAGVAAIAFSQFNAAADITVKLPVNSGVDSISYYYSPIRTAAAKSRSERGTVEGKAAVNNNKATITIAPESGPSSVGVLVAPRSAFYLYAQPGDEVLAEVTSLTPLDYTLSGTPLIDEINEVEAIGKPFETRQKALMEAGEPKQEDMMALYNEYVQAMKDYIEENITSPKVVYAVMQLRDEDYIKAFDRLSERAKTSVLYPLAEVQYGRIKESMEMERKQEEMANGSTPAPAFTLKNLDGKDVSLADFKGKWVILDFWGSWCIWCIKGFPELKEAYATHKDKLEIIGIDCRETEDAWKAGVAKYELPWVNVYCPEGNPLVSEYGIQGFPTKAIIDPEGKIRNITTGHDPEFFNVLNSLIAQ